MARLDVTSQREQPQPAPGPGPAAVADRASAASDLFEQLFRDVAGAPDVVLAGGATVYRAASPKA
ncbi:MAG TPA: hypothetical protein VJN22_03650 [Candidatus Eremiobacteraceae bacterium]|nr:hypothetical protein [Candidatus Eremiobacteraceae bacterium]